MRFPKDISSWLHLPLKNIVKFYKGIGISKDQLSINGKECILYGQLYTTYNSELIEEIFSKTNLPVQNLFIGEYNDIIIPASGETAIDISRACCVLKDKILFGGDLNILRPIKHNGGFLSYQLNGKRKLDIAKISQGASIVHLHNSDLENIFVFIPNNIIIENKIVELMSRIDKRIEAQSKIIKDLESLKEGISYQIFVNLASTWGKVDLCRILHERKTYAFKDDFYPHVSLSKEGIYPKTDRYNRDFLVKDNEKEYKITLLNDLCYNPANLKFGVICLNKFGAAIFSPIYVTFEIAHQYNPYFIELSLINKKFINCILKFEQGTVYERMSVCPENFIKAKIPIPSLDEQLHYSKIFENLDTKIQKEKGILELYKKQKTYLLQNMFI